MLLFNDKGMIIKRVDVTGKPHSGVPTPHAIDYGRSDLPDGSLRVQSPPSKNLHGALAQRKPHKNN